MLPIIDLDLKGKPEETKVVVAMSGGVDSSVAAALVKNCLLYTSDAADE